ncbi:hypothetical protein [Priestia megaterium]|uniref:hypothetical protein n=1 Tax=Priestia megaterium TaxID=1404 RepID=UPI000BFE77B6|nr:hypothetical protein [Priestia megaterium]PGO60579.1 hypothetical protein CN981_08505 [Priestia megaterium]
MKELYKWCPHCKKEELVEEREPRTTRVGTDGYGQPVRYSECECGNHYGWFDIGYYRWKDVEINDSFKGYLQSRIKHYVRSEINERI